MASLTARPAAAIEPIHIGEAVLSEAPMQPIWAIAPYHGQTKRVSEGLAAAFGLAFPDAGRMATKGDMSVAWSGLDQAFLFGATPPADLSDFAGLTDQSDAWTHVILDGAASRDVLARLVPVDLSPAALPAGSAIRTSLGHMSALILHDSGDRFAILVFRSMADTAVHELSRAMASVAARSARDA